MRGGERTLDLVPITDRRCSSASESVLPFRASPAARSWLTISPPAAISRLELVGASPLMGVRMR